MDRSLSFAAVIVRTSRSGNCSQCRIKSLVDRICSRYLHCQRRTDNSWCRECDAVSVNTFHRCPVRTDIFNGGNASRRSKSDYCCGGQYTATRRLDLRLEYVRGGMRYDGEHVLVARTLGDATNVVDGLRRESLDRTLGVRLVLLSVASSDHFVSSSLFRRCRCQRGITPD